MNKIYQKSFPDAETCRRKANTDMVAVSDTEAAGDPDTGAVPVTYTDIIAFLITKVVPNPKPASSVIPVLTTKGMPVFTTKVIPEGCSRESQPCKIKKRLRLPTETFGNDQIYKKRTCSKGFTLIELLVVVLIIGILAAVALPQYQKAVLKSRAVQAFVTLNALEKAQQEYYLANGEYTADVTELSIAPNLPEKCRCVEEYCTVYIGDGIGFEWVWEWNPPEQRHRCLAIADSRRANELCASFGGEMFRYHDGNNSNYYTVP